MINVFKVADWDLILEFRMIIGLILKVEAELHRIRRHSPDARMRTMDGVRAELWKGTDGWDLKSQLMGEMAVW